MNRAWLIQQWRLLTADRRKAGLVLSLLAVGLLLWGRLLLKEVPRVATADPEAKAKASSDGGEGSGDDADARARIERPVEVRLDPPRRLPRDLFVFDPNPYRRTGSPYSPSLPEKSDREADDQEIRVAAARDAAAGLILGSVMRGPRPRAVINGRVLAEGQSIEGFVVRRIGPREALLERDGLVVRLRM